MFLNCHSTYSLRYGTLPPSALVARARKLGVGTLVLTDINNTSATLEFVKACEVAGIKPIVGIEFRRKGRCLYIGIARNREGFRELNEFLTKHSLEGISLPDCAPVFENSYVIYPRLTKPLKLFRENEMLGVRPEYIHLLFSSEVRRFPEKLVLLHSVSFATKENFELHRILRAIDLNTLITKLTAKDTGKQNQLLIREEDAQRPYAAYPKILQNTRRVLDNCSIDFPTGLKLNRQSFTGSKEGDMLLIEKLAIKGCERRYGFRNEAALARVEGELKVIKGQDFGSYFLITWDIIRYAQTIGYHHVGRGSGANSIVAYCLFITDVDPMELDLYFERFINPYRTSPPDFDIDFSWDERDDVTDYIFKRYGKEHTALLATYSTFKGKSIIRELGKVFGLPKEEIDKTIANRHTRKDLHPLAATIFYYGAKMEGFPNYLSIHAGGVLISEEPLAYSTALQMMPKGFPITHFDMYHGEDWGYHKFDILSQRGLGHIKDAVDLVKKNQGRAIDIHEVEKIKADPKVKAQLKRGECIGCFYIESPAMRGLLSKLQCDNYVHLVAASSIIRPGVAQSGMMKEYIKRFHAPNGFEYIHPVFKKHLGETFGVMVYQEDVMKIAHHYSGLGLDESDVLRRVMSGKKAKGDTFERLKKTFFENCAERGHEAKMTQEVWRQMESFAGYSFCKAHSASYAVESFQSLYLKTYFPLEFMVAVINNFGGFYKTEYYFHEARMQGATIHPPCVNHSLHLTNIEGKDIYIGFIHLHSFEQKTAFRIIKERAQSGVFHSLADFVQRVPISAEQLELLIRIGAFRFTQLSKYDLMWEKNAVFNPRESFEATPSLFPDSYEKYDLPKLQDGEHDQTFDEIELLGFALKSPFDLLRVRADDLKKGEGETDLDYQPMNHQSAENLKEYKGRMVKIEGYYVCQKPVRTVRGELMAFGTWLDEEGRYFDTVHFPHFLRTFPFKGKGVYLIEGKVSTEFGFASVEVIKMRRLAFFGDERYGG